MTDELISILELFKERRSLSVYELSVLKNTDMLKTCDPVNWLLDKQYIKIEGNYATLHGEDLTPKTKLIITTEGELALNQEIASRKRLKFSEIRAWITAIVAVAAFVKSFFF